jgi:hypothetical protein
MKRERTAEKAVLFNECIVAVMPLPNSVSPDEVLEA